MPVQFCGQLLTSFGWEPKKDETPRAALLRASLIDALGDLDDQEIVAGCRERFQKYITDPASIAPDLRPSIFRIVGRYADDATWNKLREFGLKTTEHRRKAKLLRCVGCGARSQTRRPNFAKFR